jgi:hypothetical protein
MIAARKGTEPGLQAHSGVVKNHCYGVCADLTCTLAEVVGTTNFVERTLQSQRDGNGL